MFAPVSTKTIRLRRGWLGPSRTLAAPQLIGYITRNLVAAEDPVLQELIRLLQANLLSVILASEDHRVSELVVNNRSISRTLDGIV